VQAVPLQVDLLRADALEQVRTVTDPLEVGMLVFNAGANTYGHDFVSGDLTRLRQVVDLNVLRQLELTHHFGSLMKERRRGGILLVGSLAGYLGQPELAVYSAAKAFARIFAEGLWLELQPFDVHVLHLVLGVTRTPAMQRAGLRFDLPGLEVAEPEDVAAQGLAGLAEGPVLVVPGNERTVQHRSGLDRASLVRRAAEGHRRLLGETSS
jgi:short-subunit dehydrogenase